MDRREASEISITENASLKEALSRMLGLGFRHLPVVDEDGRLAGELALHDVESATTDGED
jgi:CBS domain-containing protein